MSAEGTSRTFQIIVHADSLAMINPDSDLITGEVFVSFVDRLFPEEQWNDFPVVILSWWCAATQRLSTARDRHQERLLFMDGPYWIEIDKIAPSSLTATMVDDRTVGRQRRLGAAAIALDPLRAQVLAASKSVLTECSRRGWSTSDIRSLRESVERLTQTLT